MTTDGSGDCRAAEKLAAKRQFWLGHLQQCQASGQGMAAYARDKGLASKSFYRWRKKLLASQTGGATPGPGLFHRVQVTPSAPTSVPASHVPAKPMAVLLRLPNGIECELRQVDGQSCADVLLALARMPP